MIRGRKILRLSSFAAATMLLATSVQAQNKAPDNITFGLSGAGTISPYGKFRVHRADGSVIDGANPATYKLKVGEYVKPHLGEDRSSGGKMLPFKSEVYGVVVPTKGNRDGTITVLTSDGSYVQYLHTSKRTVAIGQRVTPDTILGYTGNTFRGKSGKSSSLIPHLHVQAKNKSGKPVDPLSTIRNNRTDTLTRYQKSLQKLYRKQYTKEWKKSGGVFSPKVTFNDNAAKIKPGGTNVAKRAPSPAPSIKPSGEVWAAEVVRGSGITRIGVYNSYREAQQATAAWSKANPKSLALTREIELGAGKATGTAKIGFDDNAKKVPASSHKGSKTAAKPAARAVPQQPRTGSKLTVKKTPLRRSPVTSKQRTGTRSKATVRSRRAPTSKPRRNSTVNRRPSARKPAAGNRSSVRRTTSRSGSRGIAQRSTTNRSSARTSSATRNRATVRRSTNSAHRRSKTTARPAFRRPTTNSRSTYRRPAVRSSSYRPSSTTTARRSTYRRPSSSSYRTPARTAVYRRPAARSYRSPARTATYRRPTYRRPAYRPAVRRSSYTPRRSYSTRSYRRR